MMRKDVSSVHNTSQENHHSMKKLLVMALGLGIALGTVSLSFAQDSSDTTKKKMKKKKKTDDTTKKNAY